MQLTSNHDPFTFPGTFDEIVISNKLQIMMLLHFLVHSIKLLTSAY